MVLHSARGQADRNWHTNLTWVCVPHRDGTPVYINYKSQFKDGGTAAAPEARTAAKQTKGKGKRGAAAAPGPTGFMTAAWLDQQQGKGSGGRSKGRKRRSRKAKGAEGGSGGSSGGRRKRGSGGGRWSTVNGQKVRPGRLDASVNKASSRFIIPPYTTCHKALCQASDCLTALLGTVWYVVACSTKAESLMPCAVAPAGVHQQQWVQADWVLSIQGI